MVILIDNSVLIIQNLNIFVRIVFISHRLKLDLIFLQLCPFSLSQLKAFSPAMVTLVTEIPEPALNQPGWGNKAH